MELYQLRTFTVVAAEGNVTRAAKRLFTTPPSVSAHIKALETEWGVRLFERSSRGMHLTETGRRLLARAEATLAAAQDLANHASLLKGELLGAVRVGINASAEYLRIPAALSALREASPGIELQLEASSTGHILEALEAGALDAGFLYGPLPEGVTGETLTEVSLVVVGPASFGAVLREADWPALGRMPWICSDDYCPFQAMIEARFDALGLDFERAVVTDDDGTRADLVQAGVGVTLLEQSEAERLQAAGGVIINTAVPPFGCELSVCLADGSDPLTTAVVQTILEAWGGRADSGPPSA